MDFPTTIHVGVGTGFEVPLLRRSWKLWTGEKPAKSNGTPVIRPVLDIGASASFAELIVAGELGDMGATWWCWIDTFNQLAYRQGMFDVDPVKPSRPALEILGRIWVENGGTLHGAWDAFGVFPDDRIAFREVKRRGKDRLNPHQHRFADAARRAYPEIDLAVVEWTV
jgi:hypothetical protein